MFTLFLCPFLPFAIPVTPPRPHKSPSQQHIKEISSPSLTPSLHCTVQHCGSRPNLKDALPVWLMLRWPMESHGSRLSHICILIRYLAWRLSCSFLFCACLMVFREPNAQVYNKQRTSLCKCRVCITPQSG